MLCAKTNIRLRLVLHTVVLYVVARSRVEKSIRQVGALTLRRKQLMRDELARITSVP
jgi:hypothetical protein